MRRKFLKQISIKNKLKAIYTTRLVERDLPSHEDYSMYRILYYTWERPKNDGNIKNLTFDDEVRTDEPYGHSLESQLICLCQFYNEHNQDHYYTLNYNHIKEEHANYKSNV